MNTFIDGYLKVMGKVTSVVSWIMRAILAFMIVVVFCQVLSRFLHWSIPFAEELARYCNIYMAFIAMIYCMRKDSMVKVDTVQTITKGKLNTVIVILAEMISLVALLFFIWSGFKLAKAGLKQTSPTMGFQMTFIYSVIPLGCALSILNRIAFWLEKYKDRKESENV